MKENNIFIILILLTSSCSFFGDKVSEALYSSGAVTTSFNQNFKKAIADGENVIAGKIHIFLNNRDVSSHCGVAFGSGFSRKGLSFRDNPEGLLIIALDNSNSFLSLIYCDDKAGKPFEYYFRENIFQMNRPYSYFGDLHIYFVSEKFEDGYKDAAFRKFSIKKIDRLKPINLKNEIEEKYIFKKMDFIEIL